MIKSYPMTFGAMPCVVLNQIKSIADQCPDEGGFAVFAARAWYRLFEPGTDWEGLDGCGQNRASVAQTAAHERPSVRVVPNPAQGHLFVIMDTAPAQGTRFELRSATGAKVLEIFPFRLLHGCGRVRTCARPLFLYRAKPRWLDTKWQIEHHSLTFFSLGRVCRAPVFFVSPCAFCFLQLFFFCPFYPMPKSTITSGSRGFRAAANRP